MRARATTAGAWAGLVGVVAGLLMSVPLGESFNIGIALIVSPYPFIGVAAGALIGRLGVKRDDDPEDNGVVFRYGMIGGGIAGLVIGILPMVLFLLLQIFE